MLEILLPGTLVTTAVVAWAWRAWPPVYDSLAIFKVELSIEARGAGSMTIETLAQMTTCPAMLTRAIELGKLAELPAFRAAADREAVLRNMVRAEVIPNTFLIRISARDSDPTTAAAACRALVDACRLVFAEQSNEWTHRQIVNLEAYRRELRSKSEELQEQWLSEASRDNIAPAARAGIVRATGRDDMKTSLRQRVDLGEVRRLKSELLKIDLELKTAEAQLTPLAPARVRDDADDPDAAERIAAAVAVDPVLATLPRQIAEASEALAKSDPPEGDPARIAAVRRLATLSARFVALVEKYRDADRARIAASKAAPLSRELAEAQTRLDLLRLRKASYEEALKQVEAAVRDDGSTAVKIALISEMLRETKTMEDSATKQIEHLRFEAAKNVIRITRLVEPSLSRSPVSEPRRVVAAATPVAVFSMLSGLAVFRARRRRAAAPVDASQD